MAPKRTHSEVSANAEAPAHFREKLITSVKEAIDAVEEGHYPASLAALYVSIMDSKTGRSNLLPVLKGAAESKQDVEPDDPEETGIYKLYCKALVNEERFIKKTKDEFLALREKHSSPAEAIPDFVAGMVKKGELSAKDEDRMSKIWSSWLRRSSWNSLSGDYVRDHRLWDVAERFYKCKEDMLQVQKYSYVHPQHEEFLDSIGFDIEKTEKDMPGVPKAFQKVLVRVWDSDSHGGEINKKDLGLLIDQSFQAQTDFTRLRSQFPSNEELERREREAEEDSFDDDDGSTSGSEDEDEIRAEEQDKNDDKERVCKNCDDTYKRSENHGTACVWYAERHKGRLVVDWDAEFWETHGAHEGPPNSSFCKREYHNRGGYKWSGCGCHMGLPKENECERQTWHRSS